VFRETFLTGKSAGTPPVDQALARLAGRQHGLVRLDQLHALGVSDSAVTKRVARGALHRISRGVYAVGHAHLSREGEFLAAVFAAGDGAVLSYLACAELRGVWRYRASLIDVVAPRWRKTDGPIRIHRVRAIHPRDVTSLKGIPVTSMPRLLVDLADVLTPLELTNVIHEAAYRGHFSLLATQDAMARAQGRRHLKVLEQALAYHQNGSAGFKSRNEARVFAALKGLPEPLVNTRLNGEEADFHWPQFKLVVEVDGPGHARPRTRHEDERKERAWQQAGYEVLRTTDVKLIRSRMRPP
jgi:hypothetical protein